MKTLQNNFTTQEQSKRLLELGVPADSADCVNYTSPTCNGGVYISTDAIQIAQGSTFSSYACEQTYPIWSVGRLIDILFICSVYEVRTIESYRNDSLIDDIIYEFENNKMDFSKLEE